MLRRLMTKMTMMMLASLVVATGPAAAHDEYRIIGTVSKITATQIDVKQVKDGKVIEIDLDQQTKFTRDKKPVAASTVKVGQSVVVDALGDTILDLLALEVRLVPAIPTTKKAG